MNEALPPHALDLARVRRGFDRAAGTFDAAAVLHAEVRGALLARLDLTALQPRVAVDAGAGTGHASRALKRRYPKAVVIAVDTSQAMLMAAGQQQGWRRRFVRVRADAERLPFADGSVDLLLSNLMLPWCDPERAFAEFRRVLAPQGLLSFTSFGPDTLRELTSAWAAADQKNLDKLDDVDKRDAVDALDDRATHVNHFIDMHDLGDALVRAGFASPVLDVERYTLSYPDLRGLAADLKAVGPGNATLGRPTSLTGRQTFGRLQAAYEAFRRDGRLPATCEVVYGHAWAPVTTTRRESGDGTSVSLEDIKQQLRARRR